MRAVVQRVLHSHVEVNHAIVGKIERGLTVLLGVTHQDSPQDARYLAEKISGLRIFPDPDGKMNLSLQDTNGSMLAISQFTLYADCAKGRRPSFVNAAPPDLAKPLYELFCDSVRSLGIHVETGIFQADMQVTILNDGPVTIILDSPPHPPQ